MPIFTTKEFGRKLMVTINHDFRDIAHIQVPEEQQSAERPTSESK